ncbi:MAG: hypothetical protein GF370_02215 [Candidatus Nealsonbacteria bacterium]|nr:hypothetical protein [Candidatus Nealsonbacteria bacterium]
MRNIGILYNAFVSLVIGVTGVGIFGSLRRKRQKKEIAYNEGLDYFCLLSGLVWLISSIGIFYNWLDRPEVGVTLYRWITGPLTYLHLLPAFQYLGWSFFKKSQKLRWLFNGFFSLMSVAAVIALELYGFSQPEMGYWGANVVPNKLANNIFTFGLFLPGAIFILIELIRKITSWMKDQGLKEKKLLGFAFGFFLYAAGGIFAGLGAQAWIVLLARISIMTALLVFYFSTTLDN